MRGAGPGRGRVGGGRGLPSQTETPPPLPTPRQGQLGGRGVETGRGLRGVEVSCGERPRASPLLGNPVPLPISCFVTLALVPHRGNSGRPWATRNKGGSDFTPKRPCICWSV